MNECQRPSNAQIRVMQASMAMLAALYSAQDTLRELIRTVDDDTAEMIEAVMDENRKAILKAEAAGITTGGNE